MEKSLIGLYRSDVSYNDWRVGTPDASKYHDISTVSLELNNMPLAARVGTNHGFGGLRGVIIPRATRAGGSRGFDHMQPQMAYIDPQLTNGRLVIDPRKIQENSDKMTEVITEAYQTYADPADAAVAAYAQFAEEQDTLAPDLNSPLEVKVAQSVVPTPLSNAPALPQQSPYVTPSAVSRPANFGIRPQPGFKPGVQRPAPQPPDLTVAPVVPTMTVEKQGQSRALNSMRSLRSEFSAPGQDPAVAPTMARALGGHPQRKVVFELPSVGGQASLGQFTCYYHDVLHQDDTLILVYDHSTPAQHLWFPPVMEDPETKEPIAMPALVEGIGNAPDMIYLAYPTGVRFRHHSEEFCVLTIEQSKPVPKR